jgi:hypothetical protein
MVELEIIGSLMDAKVMIDRSADTVIIAHPDLPAIKFSIDHPYIQGTKIERDARAAFARSPQETPVDD